VRARDGRAVAAIDALRYRGAMPKRPCTETITVRVTPAERLVIDRVATLERRPEAGLLTIAALDRARRYHADNPGVLAALSALDGESE
jgi:uncharacterized protein (DUF1778 family)